MVKEAIYKLITYPSGELEEFDFVQDIVRCGECKYASDNKVYGCMLNHFNDNDYDYHRMYANDFCSYGEREDE